MAVDLIVGMSTPPIFESEHPWRFMPSYQAIAKLPFEQRYVALKDPAMRARLLAEQDPNDTGFSLIYKNPTLWENTYVGADPIDCTPPRERSIAEIARQHGENPWAVAYDMLLGNGGRAILTHFGVNYADQNTEAVHTMLSHPTSAWGLSDAGAHVSCIIDAGVHTYMLTR